MTIRANFIRGALASALLLACALPATAPFAAPAPAAPAARAAFSGGSLYQLDTALTDSQGQRSSLRDMAGQVAIVTMFYGDCNTACPVVIETLKRTVAALGPQGRKVKVLMVSLDPFHDSPASLAQLAGVHHLDTSQFKLAVAKDEAQTRMLAAALNIKFRVMGSGEINHTTRIVLIDAGGNVLGASSKLDTTPEPEFVKQIAAALKAG
ncbi:SCO family protein [Rugamonas apoptosis]|uniref:SCO family protein n=1 Tax=Rugamonas apoptosis TaxID=2758570 RepID=A0A7W2F975_9BURK|nr:SCO family protein [Rugamonas apoptosis]MBA5687448.1 SCO family protein [Rugamonas apoptosis]